jgi:hypothetical protein
MVTWSVWERGFLEMRVGCQDMQSIGAHFRDSAATRPKHAEAQMRTIAETQLNP